MHKTGVRNSWFFSTNWREEKSGPGRFFPVRMPTDQFRAPIPALPHHLGHRLVIRAARHKRDHAKNSGHRCLKQVPFVFRLANGRGDGRGKRSRWFRQTACPFLLFAQAVIRHPFRIAGMRTVVFPLAFGRRIAPTFLTTAIQLMPGCVLVRNELSLTIGIQTLSCHGLRRRPAVKLQLFSCGPLPLLAYL